VGQIKVCFLGTPEFAADHLQVLINHPGFLVVGVVTQPDRPAGRKMQLTPSAVKVLAQKNHLPVLTPENLRKEPEVFETIQSWQADVAVVVAFGQILAQAFLDSFKFGAVNVHGSLLPLYRGAAPIQRSLQNGDTFTGVSLQKMVFKLDAGPVISERKIELNSEINATELYSALSVLGCELLMIDLVKYVNGEITPVPQDESKVTRAFSMGPGTYVMLQGKRLKIHKSKVLKSVNSFTIGTITDISADSLVIQCGEQSLSLLEVQPESKPKLKIQDFLKSLSLKKGDLFQ